MQVLIREIKSSKKLNEAKVHSYIKTKYKLDEISNFKLIKRSIDSRKKPKIFYIYSVVFEIAELNFHLKQEKNLVINPEYTDELTFDKITTDEEVTIVGFGPSGMFCALLLARSGFRVNIIERGKDADERVKDIKLFFEENIFNPESNVVYGIGGAGTFSDGKLTTSLSDKRIRFILKEFIKHGAKKEIYYDANAHIGTDYLINIVSRMKEELITLGAKFYFEHKLIDFNKNNDLFSLTLLHNNSNVKLTTKKLILAIGHSSDETYELLHSKNVILQPKPFSLGVRIEHPQKLINHSQFNLDNFDEKAIYKLNVKANNRDIYTFCMCPGGIVVPSNSIANTIVTNGMSYNARDLENANAALLVNVLVSDYFKDSPLDGLKFRKKYEKLCYEYSNSYKTPINLVKEFLNDEVAKSIRSVKPSYPNGYVLADLRKCLPEFVVESIKEAIKLMDRKLKGFNFDDAIISAVESRSSSAVKILRDENYQTNIKNLFPMGEGAGYAGGITSSALDGIKVATYLIEQALK